MITKEEPAYEQNYTEEERKLAEHIIGWKNLHLTNGSMVTLLVTSNFGQSAASHILMQSLPSG
ncbi:hypothetical protein L0657_05375 [Dyadobacter sp. CY345]|nr:hypothetical protein [Dyadobacter sp. CY345]MCF2443379.1 hypothetical protein [Dyadobacter sp. CY345]